MAGRARKPDSSSPVLAIFAALAAAALAAVIVIFTISACEPRLAAGAGSGPALPSPAAPIAPAAAPEPTAKAPSPRAAAAAEAARAAEEAMAEDRERAERLRSLTPKLRPLQKELGEPGPGDWLAQHNEPGQTFEQYLACRPTRPTGRRNVIHVQPLGDLTATQRRIVGLAAEFMAIYFNVPSKVDEGLPLALVPEKARRQHPVWGMEQLLAGYVLDEVLSPRMPEDAAAYTAFTASDLWPGGDWNFVFGMASDSRVGVWSLYRFGDPDRSGEDFRKALLRTLKLATHETGHSFSAAHCTAWICNMCGSNSLSETDRHPLALCPECLAKICWAARAEPAERYRQLIAFCEREGLKPEAAAYGRLLAALEDR